MGPSRFAHLVVAVDDGRPRLQYSSPVRFVIESDRLSDYVDAAEFLNKSKTSVVVLQHEYGIFGGDWGKHVLGLVSSLTKPLVTAGRGRGRTARVGLSAMVVTASYWGND